jgi:hypothetical protein
LVYFLVAAWMLLSERNSIPVVEEARTEGEDNSTAAVQAADDAPEGCLPSSEDHLLAVEVPWLLVHLPKI